MPERESTWTAVGETVEAVTLDVLVAAVGCEVIEPEMTFGQIGGDSLAATRVLGGIWRTLDVRLPLSSLAPDTEVGSFLALVKEKSQQRGEKTADDAPLRQSDRRVEPLTPGQIAILLSAELSGPEGAAAATLPVVLRLRGALDSAALHGSLEALVRRHQALSLQIGDEDRAYVQRQRSVGLPELTVVKAGADHLQIAREHIRQRIDPTAPPLLRPLLIRIGPADHLLVLAIHHAACDGWSVKVLLRELAAIYAATLTGARAPAFEDAVGFLDFARWQRQLLGRDQDLLVSFWRSAMEPLPFDRWLPTDFDRPHYRTGEGGAEHLRLDRSLLAELRAFGGEQGVTTFMSFLAAYAMVLADFAAVTDVIVGVPMANRPHPLFHGTVGYLSNTVPVRVDLSGDPTVRELLGRVRRASLDAHDHQGLPLSSLVAALSPKRDVSVPPVFQVCLVLNDMQPVAMQGLDVEAVLQHKGTSPYDLTLYLEWRSDSLDGYIEYPTDLYRAATIRALRRRLIRVLRGMTADPDAKALGLAASVSHEAQ